MDTTRAVTARAITKSFGNVVALNEVDLDVGAGQVHGLVGPNGAGKTTLLGLLLGLAVADSGRLEILSASVGRTLAVPDGVAGFVDGPGLYPSLTGRQNLTALASLRGNDGRRVADVDDALEQVGLTDVADDRVRGFSLGMRQRLGLAACLLTRPRLLVLDEPANGLDPAGRHHVHRVITRLAADGVTVLVSSHRMDDLAALCSDVTILATGRVVFTGPLSKLAAESGELDYRLLTSDPKTARRAALETPGLHVVPGRDPGRWQDTEALVVRGPAPALDELVADLVRDGVAVRELAPVIPPLEAAFLALTDSETGSAESDENAGEPDADPQKRHAQWTGRTVMTATVALPESTARPAPMLQGYRFELVKLLSQWRIRLLLLACWIAPALFVAVVSQQSALPTDTVFGRWMHATAWSGSLVVLGFSCAWVLPLLTALVAGDVFAMEDRLGTWRHLLVAVRSPRRIFVAKAVASLTVILLLVAGLTVSSIVAGLIAVGNHPLVGLDGHLLGSGDAASTVLLAWISVLAPTLAFAAVGLLGSVALGRSPMGLLIPALLAFVLQLAQLLPLPVAVRLALPSHAFLAWRGLFTDPAQTDALVIGIAVSLVWAVVATGLAYSLFLRRDFTDLTYDGSGRRIVVAGVLPLAGLIGITVAVVAGTTSAEGTGIERAKVESSLATAFGHLYVMQTEQLNRPAVTEAELQATASCDRGGDRMADEGPGHDWRCVVTWHLPGTTATGNAIYQLDVTADGRYIADGDGPKEVNGYFQVQTPLGDSPNPLWQLDGNVDLLARNPKG